MEGQFLSCDWGTSSFRLALVDVGLGEAVVSRSTPDGIGVLFRHWKAENEAEDRLTFFLRYLGQQVEVLRQEFGSDFSAEKILISGMASSSIGMRELPYADLPFSLEGENMVAEEIFLPELCPYPVKLISGIKSDDDVMRGEETQMLGLRDRIGDETTLCILPGTHSKHIVVERGKITGFRTCMTGEVFQLLAKQSILAASVGEEKGWDEAAFREGVIRAKDRPLLQALFSVRTGNLFGKRDHTQGYHYLSGLLIGSEIAGLKINPSYTIILSAPEKMRQAYVLALDLLGYGNRLKTLSSEENDRLSFRGHAQVIRSVY
ncbi:MAG: 2-dehydro-3-deoxygalactonokinase [Bacteroidia bacterium]|nr:2-dehydro-3-deoxygalactonokinase [Bacteroidia bacterium]